MKYELHIPVEQYGFVAAMIETEDPDEVVEHYNALKASFSVGDGLSAKDMDKFLEEYLGTSTVKNGTESYVQMNPEQQRWVQCIKRALKRIEAKTNK